MPAACFKDWAALKEFPRNRLSSVRTLVHRQPNWTTCNRCLQNVNCLRPKQRHVWLCWKERHKVAIHWIRQRMSTFSSRFKHTLQKKKKMKHELVNRTRRGVLRWYSALRKSKLIQFLSRLVRGEDSKAKATLISHICHEQSYQWATAKPSTLISQATSCVFWKQARLTSKRQIPGLSQLQIKQSQSSRLKWETFAAFFETPRIAQTQRSQQKKKTGQGNG